jgi:hypothetical protein
MVIPRAKVPQEKTRIPHVSQPKDLPIKFSFKYIDLFHTTFRVEDCGKNYLEKFLVRLRDLCGISIQEFRSNKSSAIRAHRIDWEDTSEKEGFRYLNDQLKLEEAWQFEISKSEHGRVHGILLEETFYVVWLDPLHNLYS